MARDTYEDYDEAGEAPREMLSTGLVIVTTLVLLAAIFFMEKARAEHYDDGLMGGKGSNAPADPGE